MSTFSGGLLTYYSLFVFCFHWKFIRIFQCLQFKCGINLNITTSGKNENVN